MTARTRAMVTGSDGFLGRSLISRLLGDGVEVRALVRRGLAAGAHANGNGAAHVERVRGDVTDAGSVERAAMGCDVIFHCAFGGDTFADARRINVEGTRHVIEAAAKAGIRRVVHVSSMAVHGYVLPPVMTEDLPFTTTGEAYAVSKAEGERLAFELGAARDVEVVALRPSLVYGPRSPFWVVSYFERTKNEQLTLIDEGNGLANLVWVDDVVDAMIASWTRPDVAGEAFLISGAEPVTWREYIGRYARMCRKPLPASVPHWRARIQAPFLRVLSTLTQRPRGLSGMDLMLMPLTTTVSIDKARRRLGYAPGVSFDEGMRRCEAWLRREGYLPPAVAASPV